MRLAWFSPMPPVPSGVATVSAELVRELGRRHAIDVYVHANHPRESVPMSESLESVRVYSAHDFVWRHRAEPYDLTVYQVGNSSHHDYLWPYLFRYPGLTVLHDFHLHHARAAALLRTRRPEAFRAEFAANHPAVAVDLAELAIAGFDNLLYYSWPMSRLIVEASRLTAVHAPPLARQLREQLTGSCITTIRLAHGERLNAEQIARARAHVRGRYGIRQNEADGAVLFGVFGGLTPDKRIPQLLDAFSAIGPYAPSAHLLLAGAPARHYDVAADVAQRGLEHRVTMTGYLPTESALTQCIAACDVSLNLRWPTAREMSGPWLRALAAARPTITIDLAHLVDVPSLDPRTWKRNASVPAMRRPASGIRNTTSVQPGSTHRDSESEATLTNVSGSDPESRNPDPRSDAAVTVAIDIMDEDHSLRLAMRRLATDAALRASLGAAGQRYWELEHSMARMVEDYERALADAAARPAPRVALPAHLVTNGEGVLNGVLEEFGLPAVWDYQEKVKGKR
ncbi:MAG: glycosyltransferase [Vicinamibacterales bacterium]